MMSAVIPAPDEGSNPAMVRITGGGGIEANLSETAMVANSFVEEINKNVASSSVDFARCSERVGNCRETIAWIQHPK